jgi:ABC-type multidrug transport system ATPase subunit
VLQDDLLMASQTPREILLFSAKLRLSNKYTKEQKIERVSEIIKTLNLENCQDTRVGEVGVKRGISGGERKRVSIGVELVTNPSLLFLDEVSFFFSFIRIICLFFLFSSSLISLFLFSQRVVWTVSQLKV